MTDLQADDIAGKKYVIARRKYEFSTKQSKWRSFLGLPRSLHSLAMTQTAKASVHCSPSLAFTLAEVLITLGIIGVVAAMTIPTVSKNIQDAEFKSAWKKQYSALNQVASQVLRENESFLGVSDYTTAFQPYLKIAKRCPTRASTEGCWVPSGQNKYFSTYGGETVAGIPDNSAANKDLGARQGLILSDGALISSYPYWYTDCRLGGYICGWMLVDVNGFKKPNTVGRDVFGVWVLRDRIVPMGSSKYPYIPLSSCSTSGYGCSAKFLSNQ